MSPDTVTPGTARVAVAAILGAVKDTLNAFDNTGTVSAADADIRGAVSVVDSPTAMGFMTAVADILGGASVIAEFVVTCGAVITAPAIICGTVILAEISANQPVTLAIRNEP
jgi:hypothetical protein